jgi:hypothetical protein
MGREARCRVEFNEAVAEGKALLETDELVFRPGLRGVPGSTGAFKLRIRFAEMISVEATDGHLEVSFPGGTARFDLGTPSEAARWAERIKNPPTLMDKLDVKPGARVAVLGVEDEQFRSDLRRRAGEIVERGPADIVIFGVDEMGDLPALGEMEDWIQPDGAIWAVWRKARKELTENHVREAALAAGLVDVKVARFSDTHSALKLVVPKARRRG